MLRFLSIHLIATIALTLSLSPGAPLYAQQKPAQENLAQEKTGPGAPAAVPPQTSQTEAQPGIKIERTKEDFTTLGLAGSDLVATPPFLGGHEANKDFVRDLYQVQWRSNDPIDLFIIRPTGVKNPPVVLFLFSFPSDTKRFLDASYCKRLVSNGTAAVGFVSALTGDRYTHRPMKQWFISELQESLASTTHDVQMILNYLESRGDLDMTRVGIFGQGSGGAIAILAAAADPRIKALDLIGPWGDWPDFLAEAKGIPPQEKPNFTTPEFLKKLEPLEPVRYLPNLRTQSLRIHITDENPPTKWAVRVEKAAPAGAEIRHYASLEDLRAESASGKLFQWIANRLKPAADKGAPVQTQSSSITKNQGASQ
ncbi:MAG: alpha/beta hydrolase [Terracidiphilus sp.]